MNDCFKLRLDIILTVEAQRGAWFERYGHGGRRERRVQLREELNEVEGRQERATRACVGSPAGYLRKQ